MYVHVYKNVYVVGGWVGASGSRFRLVEKNPPHNNEEKEFSVSFSV